MGGCLHIRETIWVLKAHTIITKKFHLSFFLVDDFRNLFSEIFAKNKTFLKKIKNISSNSQILKNDEYMKMMNIFILKIILILFFFTNLMLNTEPNKLESLRYFPIFSFE